MIVDQINLSLAAAVLTSAIALVALFVSLIQTRVSVLTNRAQIFLKLSDRYNSAEITTALRALSDWRKTGDDFAHRFVAGLRDGDPAAVVVEGHRRTLDRYFVNIAQAYRAGLLNRQLANLAANEPGAAVWVEVCCPMTNALHNKTSRSLITLRKINRKIGTRDIF